MLYIKKKKNNILESLLYHFISHENINQYDFII